MNSPTWQPNVLVIDDCPKYSGSTATGSRRGPRRQLSYLSETWQPTRMRPGMTIHFIASPKDEHSRMNMTDGWSENKLQRKKIFAAFASSCWRNRQVIGGFTTPRFHQHFCSFCQPFIGAPSPSSYWIKDSKRWKNWCVGAFSVKRYKILPPKNNKIFFSIVLRRSYWGTIFEENMTSSLYSSTIVGQSS